jgi:hypothetical protein
VVGQDHSKELSQTKYWIFLDRVELIARAILNTIGVMIRIGHLLQFVLIGMGILSAIVLIGGEDVILVVIIYLGRIVGTGKK